MNAAQAMPFAFIGFSMIAMMTWFFSSRPRLFIKTFVPKEEYRHAVRSFLRNPDFGKGMRSMACLQFAVAVLFGIVAIWSWVA